MCATLGYWILTAEPNTIGVGLMKTAVALGTTADDVWIHGAGYIILEAAWM
jgi:hypothetical protein